MEAQRCVAAVGAAAKDAAVAAKDPEQVRRPLQPRERKRIPNLGSWSFVFFCQTQYTEVSIPCYSGMFKFGKLKIHWPPTNCLEFR